jgi:hypothetical protein
VSKDVYLLTTSQRHNYSLISAYLILSFLPFAGGKGAPTDVIAHVDESNFVTVSFKKPQTVNGTVTVCDHKIVKKWEWVDNFLHVYRYFISATGLHNIFYTRSHKIRQHLSDVADGSDADRWCRQLYLCGNAKIELFA